MSSALAPVESHSNQVRVYSSGEAHEGVQFVQFRLLYSGQLLGASRTDTRAGLKHSIRLEISPQLKRLWQTNKNLRRLASFRARNWAERHPEIREELRPGLPANTAENWTEEELHMCGLRYLAEKWERCGQGYIPLITEDMGLRCGLDILFLRPEEPGMVIRGGDLDNRLKTIFDALRLPQNLEEAGGAKAGSDEEPIYCLLEDDRLISEVRVVSDQLLLLPKEKNITANDVFLVMDVKLECPAHSQYSWVFG